jgi:hypothetical protein
MDPRSRSRLKQGHVLRDKTIDRTTQLQLVKSYRGKYTKVKAVTLLIRDPVALPLGPYFPYPFWYIILATIHPAPMALANLGNAAAQTLNAITKLGRDSSKFYISLRHKNDKPDELAEYN